MCVPCVLLSPKSAAGGRLAVSLGARFPDRADHKGLQAGGAGRRRAEAQPAAICPPHATMFIPRRRAAIIVVALGVPVLAAVFGSRLLTDVLWFREVVHADVYWRMLAFQVTLLLGVAGAVSICLLATLRTALRRALSEVMTRQAQLVTANLTGATRLLLTTAIAMPALGAVLLRSHGQAMPRLVLNPARRLDLAVLALAALSSLFVIARGRLTLIEGIILGALYVLYMLPGQDAEDEHPAAIGVAAEIASLDRASRRRLYGALLVFAAVAVFMTARAFPAELLRAGQAFGIDPYLLIQWVIPLFTEVPELVVAGALVLYRRPAEGVALLLAASVTQWTLALASISGAYLLGGGGPALPLSGRARRTAADGCDDAHGSR